MKDLKACLTHFCCFIPFVAFLRVQQHDDWGRKFPSRLCSCPDLYVISVLSDHLPRHVFPCVGVDYLWWTHRAAASLRSRYIQQLEMCLQRMWRWEHTKGRYWLALLAEWCSELSTSFLHVSLSSQRCVNVPAGPKRTHQMLFKHYWRCEGPNATPTLDGYPFLDALTLKVGSVFGSIGAQQQHQGSVGPSPTFPGAPAFACLVRISIWISFHTCQEEADPLRKQTLLHLKHTKQLWTVRRVF